MIAASLGYCQGERHSSAISILVHINAMNLEDVLGKIQTDRANLHVDGLLICDASPDDHSMAPRCRAGAVHCIRVMTIEDFKDDDRSDPPC